MNKQYRILIHYLYAFFALLIYGGQVCPFLEKLSLLGWFGILSVVMIIQYGLRMGLIRRYVAGSSYDTMTFRRFFSEFSPFFLSGILITVFNLGSFGFPIGSGLKVVLGFSILGFFAAADQALAQEREINQEVIDSGTVVYSQETYFPITRKFSLVAVILMLAISSVFFLVVVKDLDWLLNVDQNKTSRAVLIILGEIAFILSILLIPTVNLIFSFARNLKIFLSQENKTLMDVSKGHLNRYVPVSSTDEFGIMARYTNQMIDGLKDLNQELELTQEATIRSLASLAETRDNETGQHIIRTQRYVRALAEQLRDHPRFKDTLDDPFNSLLYKSAPLHDIGKVGVPDRILLKPGKLDEEEWEEMKRHTIYGHDALIKAEESLVSDNSFLRLAREIAYSHHEKWDGSGYPRGLTKDQIPISGRIMALSDVYDALISKRVYKSAFSQEDAKGIIVEGKDKHFDPDIVDAFLIIENEFMNIADQFRDST